MKIFIDNENILCFRPTVNQVLVLFWCKYEIERNETKVAWTEMFGLKSNFLQTDSIHD